jgi:hypothetical protein
MNVMPCIHFYPLSPELALQKAAFAICYTRTFIIFFAMIAFLDHFFTALCYEMRSHPLKNKCHARYAIQILHPSLSLINLDEQET